MCILDTDSDSTGSRKFIVFVNRGFSDLYCERFLIAFAFFCESWSV